MNRLEASKLLTASVYCVDSVGEYIAGNSFTRSARIDAKNICIYVADPANTTHIVVTQSGKAVFKASWNPQTGLVTHKFIAGDWIEIIQSNASSLPPSQNWTLGQELQCVPSRSDLTPVKNNSPLVISNSICGVAPNIGTIGHLALVSRG